MSKTIALMLAAMFAVAGVAFSGDVSGASVRQLRTYVDQVLKEPPSSIRDNVGFIFKLVDLLLHEPVPLPLRRLGADVLSPRNRRKAAILAAVPDPAAFDMSAIQ